MSAVYRMFFSIFTVNFEKVCKLAKLSQEKCKKRPVNYTFLDFAEKARENP